MYGTVARMKVKPGSHDALMEYTNRIETDPSEGHVFSYVYKVDGSEDEYVLVTGFTSKEAYVANANRPETHARYEEYRALLASDPEWTDGEIIREYRS
jgi:quinol monooxygenase YgiN